MFRVPGRGFHHFIQSFIWLVVSTPLKNISQNGNLPQVGMKKKWNHNHHLVMFIPTKVMRKITNPHLRTCNVLHRHEEIHKNEKPCADTSYHLRRRWSSEYLYHILAYVYLVYLHISIYIHNIFVVSLKLTVHPWKMMIRKLVTFVTFLLGLEGTGRPNF